MNPQDRESRFKGFMAAVTLDDEPIGTMESTDEDNMPKEAKTRVFCDDTAISHADSTEKYEVFFQWKAPADLDPLSKLKLR